MYAEYSESDLELYFVDGADGAAFLNGEGITFNPSKGMGGSEGGCIGIHSNSPFTVSIIVIHINTISLLFSLCATRLYSHSRYSLCP
jgi:hypothetical protein